MEKYYIGYIFDDLYTPEAAEWCNEQGNCHIEKNSDGKYVIAENIEIDDPNVKFESDGSIPYLELQDLVEKTYLQAQYNAILIETIMGV